MVQVPVTTQTEEKYTGNNAPLPGRYLGIIQEAKEDETKGNAGGIFLDILILSGTTPAQEGKVLKTWVWLPDPNSPKYNASHWDTITKLALVLGLIQPGQVNPSFDITHAEGRQLVIDVEIQKNRDGEETGYMQLKRCGTYSVHSPEYRDVPKPHMQQAGQQMPPQDVFAMPGQPQMQQQPHMQQQMATGQPSTPPFIPQQQMNGSMTADQMASL
jgi:hypothetical protein